MNLINQLLVCSLLLTSLHLSPSMGQKTRKSKPRTTTSNSPKQTDNLNQFPKLIYMAPSEPDEFTINERNSFTNELKFGWILKENQKIDMLFYMLVEDKINLLDDIESSYLFYTTSKSDCSLTKGVLYEENMEVVPSNTSTLIFKLDFLDERSKLYQNVLVKSRSRLHRISQRNSNTTDAANMHNNTMLVAHALISLPYEATKYYACLSFAKKTKNDNLTIDLHELRFVHQGEKNIWTHIITTKDFMPVYVVVIVYVVLLLVSALCSGLNLGLMSLDLSELNLLKKIGSPQEKLYANKIYPLRKHGNLLLCSILLGNVLVNSTSTLILGSYLEGVFAAIGSTIFIVLFGEIFPQAACSRYGLAIGAKTRYIMYAIMAITFVVAYPLSKVLDFILGKEIAMVYSRDKVRELMRRAKDGKDGIEEKQFKLISGALDFKSKTVEQIMVPAKDVFSLDINAILDFDTFKTILYHGYSRIPVHEFTK